MRYPAIIWLVSTVAWCQLPQENVRFQALKKSPIDLKSGHKKMAIGYEVLYGITDKGQIRDAYQAGIYFQKGAKSAKAYQFLFPEFEKKMLTKGDVENDDFMVGLVTANHELRQTLASTEPGEIRREALMSLYVQFPYHTPTILAAAQNERLLGYRFTADQLVRYVDNLETADAFWPLLVAKAEMARDAGDLEKAHEFLDEAGKIGFSSNPAKELWRSWNAERTKAQGDPQALAEIGDLEGLQALGKKNHEALFQSGRVYEKRGLKVEAKKAYLDAFKYGDDQAYHALTAASHVIISVTDLAGIARTAKKLADKGVEDPHVLTMAALDQKYDKETRIQKLEEVVQRYPDFGEAQLRLISVYRSAGHVEPLLRQCRETVARDPSQANVQIAISYFVNQGQLAEAVDLFKEHLETYRNDPIYLGLGHMLNENGSRDIDPDLSERVAYELVREGLACAKRFDFERGADMINRAKSLWPEQPDLTLLTANIYKNGGKSILALPHYEESAERYPESAPLLELLGDCYFANDQLNKAIEAYETSQSLDSSRALLPFKIKDAKKQRNKKLGTAVVGVLAVMTGGIGISNGSVSLNFYVHPTGYRHSKTSFGLDEETDGPASGYGVEETAPLLRDLFVAYLDLEEKYASP